MNLVITRHNSLNSFSNTRAYHSGILVINLQYDTDSVSHRKFLVAFLKELSRLQEYKWRKSTSENQDRGGYNWPQKQMERWVEYYLDLYSSETSVSHEALDPIQDLSILHEVDADPMLDECNEAIDVFSCKKSPWNDSILPEVIKHGKLVLVG